MHINVLVVLAIIAFFVIPAVRKMMRGAQTVAVQPRIPNAYQTSGSDDDPELRELEALEQQERDAKMVARSRQLSGQPPVVNAGGTPQFGGMAGLLAKGAVGAFAVAVAAATDGEVDLDGVFGSGNSLAASKERFREIALDAKRTGKPVDAQELRRALTEMATGQAPDEPRKKGKGGSKKSKHHHSPSGDDVGIVFGIRPPIDARPMLAPLKPLKMMAKLQPVPPIAPLNAQ